jgi:phytoene dehydrogenase-like protein
MNMANYVGRILSQLYNYYPAEGYLHLCKLIQSVITENGGELLTGARVTKIRVENNVATGVDYRFRGQTQTVRATNTISAIDLSKAFNELLGRDVVPSEDLRKLDSSTLGLSVPVLFLGVIIAPERLRQIFGGKEELHYYPSVKRADADLNGVDFFWGRQMVIHASSLVNPTHAPAGCSNIQLYLSCPPVGWQNNWALMNGQRTEPYRKLKDKVIIDVLASLEKVIPELKDRSIVEVCELGTPHTNERYTGNTNGVALGFNFDGYRMGAARIGSYYSRLGGVSHLFFIGHQTGYGGGLNVAFGSARRVAHEIGRQR